MRGSRSEAQAAKVVIVTHQGSSGGQHDFEAFICFAFADLCHVKLPATSEKVDFRSFQDSSFKKVGTGPMFVIGQIHESSCL